MRELDHSDACKVFECNFLAKFRVYLQGCYKFHKETLKVFCVKKLLSHKTYAILCENVGIMEGVDI